MPVRADDVVVVGGARTAFSKYGGALKEMSSIDVGSKLLPGMLDGLGVPPSRVEMLVCATSISAEVAQHTNLIGRQALLFAGLPESIPSYTVDQASASGMKAVHLGRQEILTGGADVVVVLGTEAMSNASFLLPAALRWGRTRGDLNVRDPLFPLRLPFRPQGVVREVDAEAETYGVLREAMDTWAYESQRRFAAAQESGFIGGEIVPVELGDGKAFDTDEQPKPWTTPELLGKLPTIFGSKYVTAGNSPGLETGAAALVLTRRSVADELSLPVLAMVEAATSTSGEVGLPLSQTARAVERLLQVTGTALGDVDVLELEEAFAAVVPIAARYLERAVGASEERLLEITNPNGGAIAVGHPIGASGVRLVLSLARQLERTDARMGVAAMAGALSQGAAVLLSRP